MLTFANPEENRTNKTNMQKTREKMRHDSPGTPFDTAMRLLAILIVCCLLSTPTMAGQRYTSWSNPERPASGQADRQSEHLQEFIDRLKALIDSADKSRAADPMFLRDLRDLAGGYDRPWRKLLLNEDFGDGDFTANPPWTVTAGRYQIEKSWGLRAILEPSKGQSSGNQKREKVSGRDVALAFLGAVLDKAVQQPDSGQRTGATGTAEEPAFNAIHTAVPISNAFAIELELSSWKDQGGFEIGPYQGAARTNGYRLAYRPGVRLELLRATRQGSSVMEISTKPLQFEDQKVHRVEWTRRADGGMTVTVDDEEIFSLLDRSFKVPFDGLMVVNRGGDIILKRVTIFGVEAP